MMKNEDISMTVKFPGNTRSLNSATNETHKMEESNNFHDARRLSRLSPPKETSFIDRYHPEISSKSDE